MEAGLAVGGWQRATVRLREVMERGTVLEDAAIAIGTNPDKYEKRTPCRAAHAWQACLPASERPDAMTQGKALSRAGTTADLRQQLAA
jgi:hypothetical protein